MKRIARIAAAVIFVALVPLLLITSSVRFVINLPALYSYGFDRYGIAEYTRIERNDLIAAGKQIRDYFNNDERDLIIRTYVGGVLVESLYNEREIHHMRDVKGLVWGVYMVQMLTLLYMAVYVLVGFWRRRAEFWGTLGRDVSRGGKLTLVLVIAVGLLALVAFNQVFLLFHLISFSNDFWMLDPAPRLPDSDVPAGLLLRRNDADRLLHHRVRRRAGRRTAHCADNRSRLARARELMACCSAAFTPILAFPHRGGRDFCPTIAGASSNFCPHPNPLPEGEGTCGQTLKP